MFSRLRAMVVILLVVLYQPVAVGWAGVSPWDEWIRLVWQAERTGAFQEADQLFAKLVKARSRLPEGNFPLIHSLLRLADYYQSQGRFDQEEASRVRAFQLLERTFGPDDVMLVGPLKDLARIWWHRQELARAIQALTRALGLIERNYGPGHLLAVDILEKLGQANRLAHNTEAAQQLELRAIGILQNTVESGTPAWAMMLMAEARIDKTQGLNGRVAMLFGRALDVLMKTPGPYHSARVFALLESAEIQRQTDPVVAADHYKSALAISENMNGDDQADLPSILAKQAEMLQEIGKVDQGRPLLTRALVIMEKTFGKLDPQTAEYVYRLGDNLRLENQLEPALPLYRRALSTLRTQGSKADYPVLAKVLTGMTQIFYKQGKIIEAEHSLREAMEWLAVSQDVAPKTIADARAYHAQLVREMTQRKPTEDKISTQKEQIGFVQKRLTDLGYDPGPVDGLTGPKTRQALNQFEKKIGFEPSTQLDQPTLLRALEHLPPKLGETSAT